MKKIKIITLMLIITLSFGCKKFLDVNHDPNSPEESSVEYVFPAGVASTASVFGGSWSILGEIWSQHWTSQPNAPSFQGEDKYSVQAGDYSYDLRGWESIYTAALMDYEWVRNDARASKNWTYYLMATTMQCYTYQVMVDFFDNIPFSEALQKVPAPFENGQEIYDSLIVRLDFALAQNLEGDSCITPLADDVVFGNIGGGMNNWVAFANTLKLKIYLRQRFARPDVASAGIAKLYSDGVTFLSVDAGYGAFDNETGRDNYLYAAQFRGRTDICPSRTILDYITNDKRLNFIFTSPELGNDEPYVSFDGDQFGMYQGDINNVYSDPDNEPDKFSEPNVQPLQLVYFISNVESKLLQAEACLIYGVGDAQSLFNEALTADYLRKGVADYNSEDPPVLVAVTPTPVTFSGDVEQDFETIMVEKWIAFTNTQGMEAFLEHNRTGYPKESAYNPTMDEFSSNYVKGEFTVSVTGVLSGSFPRRLLLPASEESKNPEHWPGRTPLDEPVWWDVN